MITFKNFLLEAELNLEWWNSKSPSYKKRYLEKHPNSIYANAVKSGEIEVEGGESEGESEPEEKKEAPKEKPTKIKGYITAEDIQKIHEQIKSTQEEIDKIKKDVSDITAVSGELRSSYIAERDKKRKEISDQGKNYWVDPDYLAWDENQEYTRLHRIRASKVAEWNALEERIKRYERKIRRSKNKNNFLERVHSNTSKELYGAVVDFHGINKETEEEVMKSMESNLERYPFMKEHFDFIGSHKSSKFREISQEFTARNFIDQIDTKVKSYESDIKRGLIRLNARYSSVDPTWEDKPLQYFLDRYDSRQGYDWELSKLKDAQEYINKINNAGGADAYVRKTYQGSIEKRRRLVSRTWACYVSDASSNVKNRRGMIYFNENSIDDANLKHCVEVKWHPEGCDTPKSVLDHEFGHSVWYKLGLDKVAVGDGRFIKSPLQEYISRFMRSNTKNSIKEALSEYAATNQSEFFAEAFSEYLNNPNPREVARKVGELLDIEIRSRIKDE